MKRELIILIAAVVMGIAAVAFYKIQIDSEKKKIMSQIKDTVEVCVLKKGLAARKVIRQEHLKKGNIPQAFLHPRAIKWTDRKLVIGQRIIHPMQSGQPVLWSDTEEQTKSTVDASILPGRAVVTIPIDLVGGVSGLISPGSRVDLFGVFKDIPTGDNSQKANLAKLLKNKKPQSLSDLNAMMNASRKVATMTGKPKAAFHIVPLATNLGVFAVGTRTQSSGNKGGEDRGYSTISFDVPAQMQILLIMAMQKAKTEGGRMVCVLRSSQVGSVEELEAGKSYPSYDFLKIISTARDEISKDN